jgi:hypothetical protein
MRRSLVRNAADAVPAEADDPGGCSDAEPPGETLRH